MIQTFILVETSNISLVLSHYEKYVLREHKLCNKQLLISFVHPLCLHKTHFNAHCITLNGH